MAQLANTTYQHNASNCSYGSSPIIDLIDSVICSSIAVFGIIGNLFSIAVFHRTNKLRRLTSSVYLIALAVSDTVFLTTLLLSTVALSLLQRSAVCKTIFYFMNVSGVFSSWLVVLFTVERFVVIYFPINKIVKFSRRRAGYLVSFLIPTPFLMYIYTAIVLIDVDPVTNMCYWRSEYVFTVAIIHSVETCLTYFIPALTVVVLNWKIGLKLIKNDVERQCMRTGSMLSQGQHVMGAETNTRTVDDEEDRFGVIKQLSLRFSRSRSVKSLTNTNSIMMKTRRSSALRTSTLELSATRTLIVISTAFAVLNLPHNLVLLVKLIFQLTPQNDSGCDQDGYLMNAVTTVCNALYYANFAVNIIVYHLTSCNYRQGARQLLTRYARLSAAVIRSILVSARIVSPRGRGPIIETPERRQCLRRRAESRDRSMSGDRFGFLHILHRSSDLRSRSPDPASKGQQVAARNENEPPGLSTIPEVDGALTDPKSNPLGTDGVLGE